MMEEAQKSVHAINLDKTGSPDTRTAMVYPRRKAGEAVRSATKAIVLTIAMVEPFFGTPLKNAAFHMGLCPTALKSVCRKLGIQRWPYQQKRVLEVRPFAQESLAGEELELEGEMSEDMSSVSCATTVPGEQSSTSEAPFHDTITHYSSPQSQCLDMSSEAGLDDSPIFDDEGGDYAGLPGLGRAGGKSNGDGPACLSSLMLDTSSHSHIEGHGIYPYFPHYLPAQRKEAFTSKGIAHPHLAKHTSNPGRAADDATPVSDSLWLGVEAEVELSKAAKQLTTSDWSVLVQHIAEHQSKWDHLSSTAACDDADSSVCDMAFLSPCS